MSLVFVGCVVCLGCCWPKDALLACWPRFLQHAPDYCLNPRRASLNMDRKTANCYLRCLPRPFLIQRLLQRLDIERASVIQRLAAPGSKVKGRGSAAALLGGACGYGARRRPAPKKQKGTLECPGKYKQVNFKQTYVSVNMSVC